MTPAQLTTFKAAILANTSVSAELATRSTGLIADYYNVASTGNIWKPDVDSRDLNSGVVWSEYAVLSAQLQNTYQAMIIPGTINATNPNIRGGMSTVFSAGSTSRANLLAIAQRAPTRLEALYLSASASAIYGQLCTNELVIQALGS